MCPRFSHKPCQGSSQRFDVNPVKQNMLAAADARGAQFLNFLLALGTFSIITSAMLIVTVFVTLSNSVEVSSGWPALWA